MSENALLLFNISRTVFLLSNILLTYSVLTPRRPWRFQLVAFAGTWITQYLLRDLLTPSGLDPFLIGYMMTILYLVPIALVFKETMHAKFFVLFMVTSLSQFNFLIALLLELLVFNHMVGGLILAGQLLELASILLIRRYVTPHIKNILEILNHQNPILTAFPFLSFVLLAFYGVEKRTYLLPDFIPLVMAAIIIFISYYLIAVAIDRSKRQQQLELVARTDGLTGLYNRRYMEEIIQTEYERYQGSGTEFALIIADIDVFKEINDMYGHACGDCLLKSVSDDLRNSVRKNDTVVRWGGDEFLLLLPATDEEAAAGLAERIRETVEKRRYVYENNALAMTLTLGVYVIGSGDTVDSMIQKADIGMYQGKRAGRNRVMLADRSTSG
ncbi:MAG: GGDEF domain-containing protein [Negativicutes bacterium]|nr:GGDEF domain-containing protein [Negativicutes bacterium]